MPHIHEKPGQHDLTVGGFIFIKEESGYKLLLHEHRKYKTLLHFGGHVELNESIWSALVHELKEESGYDISQLTLLQPPNRVEGFSDSVHAVLAPQPLLINTHDTGSIGVNNKKPGEHYHIDMVYALIAKGDPKHEIAEGESGVFVKCSLSELQGMVVNGQATSFISETADYVRKNVLDSWDEVPASKYKTTSR